MTEQHNKPLEISGVVKSYGARPALKGVDLTLNPGEFVGLLGPNGAGKSTLFQILCGLFVADEGDVQVRGYDMRRKPVAALAGIGVVFQQATLDLDLSVAANLKLHGRLHGLSSAEIKQRTHTELERLGLLERMNDKCRSLSGGNRRKVELARALLHEPQVLLMDEATVGLDPASRVTLLDEVLRLCRDRGHAVLWSTHLVDEAARADRVVLLNQGAVMADSTPQELADAHGEGDLGQAFLSMTGRQVA